MSEELDDQQTATKKYVASFLGITDEELERIDWEIVTFKGPREWKTLQISPDSDKEVLEKIESLEGEELEDGVYKLGISFPGDGSDELTDDEMPDNWPVFDKD